MKFMDLGFQPMANSYLKKNELNKKEKKYRLLVEFNNQTKVVSIKKKFSSKFMFTNKYPYRSSMSKTMKESFKNLALKIKKKIKPNLILEIGSNDGSFIKHFNKKNVIGVEPCLDVAKITKRKNYIIYDKYWTKKLARKILKNHQKIDVIYSANTISHIKNLNEVFKSINILLNAKGILIIEDPSLLECLKKNTYDQFYNEHIYVFSLIGLQNILNKHGLEIFKVEKTETHGGSNRYYIKKNKANIKVEKSVLKQKNKEIKYGLANYKTYLQFYQRVKTSKEKLISIFKKCKTNNKKIIGYGATAKSSTILNYCKIDNSFLDYFLDTTHAKQNKFTPGTKIPIKKYHGSIEKNVDYVFLGAWNFKKEIFQKEKRFIKNGGKFIIHTPMPKII